jgi:glyoxylase-like metal-dependent hydrolase (beta-lactamase superfamily II)
MGLPEPELADDILRISTLFANLYIIGTPERWVLLDTGLPRFARTVVRSAERRFGSAARPQAILLTHGHWDHAGNALELSKLWDVPIFAHALELPYLTGKSGYAPKDPTVGGMIGMAARVFPSSGYDLGERVLALPDNGAVPALPEWLWIHTPGHTHGHLSLWRQRDGVLLAGDALTTVNQDNPYTAARRRPEFYRPPAPFTVDWDAAGTSICTLASLAPQAAGAGHGLPIAGPDTADRLLEYATSFERPGHGRYTQVPAHADASGIITLPPPVPDETGRLLAVWAVTGVAGVAAVLIAKQAKRYLDRGKAEAPADSTKPAE